MSSVPHSTEGVASVTHALKILEGSGVAMGGLRIAFLPWTVAENLQDGLLIQLAKLLGGRSPLEHPYRSKEHASVDTALQAVITIGTFGAGVSFSTLHSSVRAGVDDRTKVYLAWAFALNLCAAILSLNARLSGTIDPHQQLGRLGAYLRLFVLVLGVLLTLVATMFMALSLTSNFLEVDTAVRSAGYAALIIVGIAGFNTISFARSYAYRNSRFRKLMARGTARSTACQPPEGVRGQIEEFLWLRARYGKAREHLLKAQQTFAQLDEGAQGTRLGYAAMAFSSSVSFPMNVYGHAKITNDASAFLAPTMRKWDKILDILIKEHGEEDNFWHLSWHIQVLKMWWLYEAHGRDENAARSTGGNDAAATAAAVQEGGGQTSAEAPHVPMGGATGGTKTLSHLGLSQVFYRTPEINLKVFWNTHM